TPRGAFCMMGVCQECVAWVDGVWRQTCQTYVADGMEIELDRTP
ncbi:MAG: 2Fe-2S iron-sulfur cluster-binding protein, partial [Pseudomonadota bacterium]